MCGWREGFLQSRELAGPCAAGTKRTFSPSLRSLSLQSSPGAHESLLQAYISVLLVQKWFRDTWLEKDVQIVCLFLLEMP